MTTEEKAKAYDEALATAKRVISNNCTEVEKLCLACVFPQLRESEDERIRKEIIDFIQWAEDRGMIRHDYHQAKRPAIWITYLEKQKEQKPIISAEESLGISPEEYNKIVDECIYGEQKEQNPVGDGTRAKIISRATSEKQVILVSESDGNAEIGWDTRSLEDAKNLLEYGISFINKQLGVNPAEWSEEDERILNEIIETIEATRVEASRDLPNCSVLQESYWAMSHWLKSLHPHWKPSEEQMKALFTASERNDKLGSILNSLYYDLKNNYSYEIH